MAQNGDGPLTNYAAFVELLEKSVQSVDPSVALPYCSWAHTRRGAQIETSAWVETFDVVHDDDDDGDGAAPQRIDYASRAGTREESEAAAAEVGASGGIVAGSSEPRPSEKRTQLTVEGRFAVSRMRRLLTSSLLPVCLFFSFYSFFFLHVLCLPMIGRSIRSTFRYWKFRSPWIRGSRTAGSATEACRCPSW